MSMKPCLERLINILQRYNRYESRLTGDSRLDDDLGIDSLGLLSLIADIEAEFDIEPISDSERTRANFGTIGTLALLIDRKPRP